MPFRVRAVVVIPTFNARDLLADALASIEAQTVPVEIVVVDNASTDGTVEMLETRFPRVAVVRNSENLGFGRAVNRGVEDAAAADVIVLVNNDAVCEPDFMERLLDRSPTPAVGMVAGVLLQGSAPELVDSAGIELDTTLRSWDMLWNRPVDELAHAAEPVGPCGGAAAYRRSAFVELGGFDERFFAYWEDVDLALRFRLARAGVASGRPERAPSTATGRRSVQRRPPRDGSRRTAARTSSPSIASRAPACSCASRSPRSTGRCWSSTRSSGASWRLSARVRRGVATAWRFPPCAHLSSLRPSGFARRSAARRACCNCASAVGYPGISESTRRRVQLVRPLTTRSVRRVAIRPASS